MDNTSQLFPAGPFAGMDISHTFHDRAPTLSESMKYWYYLLLLCLLPGLVSAQPAIRGLGQYIPGITTVDSLKNTSFKEESQPLVKGTIALPCVHIRTFKATSVVVSGLAIADVYLFFYDNTLFKFSCQYTPELEKVFLAAYGSGRSLPQRSLPLCRQHPNQPMIIRAEGWQNGDTSAQAVHAKGYTATCELIRESRLIVASQRFSALSSDCELQSSHPFIDDFAGQQR